MNLPISAFININKPAGITSHDVINKLRKWTKIKRIGHAGTLDPLATGVLPIALGSACRLLDYLSDDKVYLAEILLGVKTTTDDISGEIIGRNTVPKSIDRNNIESLLSKFTGTILQKPPLYSAIRQNGQRLYNITRRKLNRQASELEKKDAIADMDASVKPRSVTISKIDLIDLKGSSLTIRVFCAAGTYIRSLARDIGEVIGCGACLESLRREKSGDFIISEALELTEIENLIKQNKLAEVLLSPQKLIDFELIELNLTEAINIAHGRFIALSGQNQRRLNNYLLAICPELSNINSQTIALCLINKENILQPQIVLIDPYQLQNELEKTTWQQVN